MASIINSFDISGIDGYLVEIETDTIHGKPSISIIGLGDRAIKEASERIQAAVEDRKAEDYISKFSLKILAKIMEYIKSTGNNKINGKCKI